jgi:hypothetical protein
VPVTGFTPIGLPPKWDGADVEWRAWEATDAIFICPRPKPEPCTGCRSTRSPIKNVGRVHADDAPPGSGWSTWRLFVFRCPDCHLDTVWDIRTGEWWELDETDYGPAGSHPPLTLF